MAEVLGKCLLDTDQFGILTLATPNDYIKAIGLAMSVRISNPGVPIAVACSASVKPLVEKYFDHVIEEQRGLRGFVHKVYLDHYSPFAHTLFFDSDVLVFRSVMPYVEKWRGRPYTACGSYVTGGVSSFGMDRAAVIRKLGRDALVCIDGAGHAYFERATAGVVFDKAREITRNYLEWAGPIRYADEDVMNITMTLLGLSPVSHEEFFSRHLSAVPGTLSMDASRGVCTFTAVTTGAAFSPCMMHFAADEAPLAYTWQLHKLFRRFGEPTRSLLGLALQDLWTHYVRDPLSPFTRRVRQLLEF